MATYYIDPTGVDDAGRDGLTTGTAWATLSYACTRATTAGDTIYVNPGTYTETAQSVLSVGVNIMGAGITSVITSANALDPIVLAQSTSEGTSGSQSISFLKFDGNSYTAVRGVAIWKRSNVIVHHCTFENFLSQGISFRGQHNSTGGPTTYSTGNKFHDNIIYNCSRYTTYGTGCLEIGGQSGMLVYNDTITVVDRGGTSHGYGIKGTADGWNKGLKIYDNVITVPEFENTGYNFAIELWTQRGGIEIYRNTLKGAIDIGGWDTNDEGGYGFAVKIYGNTIGYDANQTYSTSGIYLEPAVHQGIYIYRNYFKNMKYGIRLNHFTGDLIPGMDDIYIYYNIFYNLREVAAGLTGFGIVSYTADGGYQAPLRNLNILNNVFYNPTAGTMSTVIWIRGLPEVSDITIKNNIIYNTYNGVTFESSTVNGLDINNNIFYNATSHDVYFESSTVNDSTTTGNLTSDPLFIGGSPYSYALQPNSPAIDAGLDVGLISDFIGTLVPYGSAPDIGAYEWFEVVYDYQKITLVNTPACYNEDDPSIISRWVATECPINFTLLRRDWYVINSSDVGGFLAISVYGTFSGNDGDVISVYDLTTNSMYTGTITDSSGDPVLITDIPYVAGMDIKYLNDHTLYAGYYFEGRLTINGVVESLTVIASPDSFGYADLDVSGILRIKTSIGKVTNYLSLIQKDYNKSGSFTLEYRGCWYGSNEAWISEGSQTSPASEVIWYYAECVRSEEQGCNLAEYVPTDLNNAPFLNQFDTPVYWYGLPFDLSFILPERPELSPTSDIIVTMKVYNSANVQMGADISQTISVDSLEGYVNSLNIDSTLIDAGAAYFTVEITAM